MRPDSETLEIIIGYCDEIAEDMQRFGTDEEDFLGDKAYQKCIAFTILQIGEQVKRLSKGLTSTYSDVEWSDIARMRDFMAHKYERLLPTILWRTINGDIPHLRERCRQIVSEIESGKVVIPDEEDAI